MEQSSFADFYFRVHDREHMVDLKKKMQRICEMTAIQRRHFVWSKELLAAHPCLRAVMEPSHNVRQEVMHREIPRLGAEAAKKAIEERGQPKPELPTSSSLPRPGWTYPAPTSISSTFLASTPTSRGLCSANRAALPAPPSSVSPSASLRAARVRPLLVNFKDG